VKNKYHMRFFIHGVLGLGLMMGMVSCMDFSHEYGHNKHQELSAWNIVNVDWQWKAKGDFKGIYEAAVGSEYKVLKAISRSDPGERDGLYLIVRLNRAIVGLPKDACVIVEYITSESPQIKTQVFVMNATSIYPEMLLGLTGKQKPAASAQIVAWKMTLRTADGIVLARKESFAWRY